MKHMHLDPHAALPLDERIRLAEQAVIDRDERVRAISGQITGRWHGMHMPSVAQGAGAGVLAGLGSWFVRRAFSARRGARHHARAGSPARLDLVLQFLPLLLPLLPARLQRWVKPSRLMLGLALAAPLFSAWQSRRQARDEAEEQALVHELLQERLREQRHQHDMAAQQPSPAAAGRSEATDEAAEWETPDANAFEAAQHAAHHVAQRAARHAPGPGRAHPA